MRGLVEYVQQNWIFIVFLSGVVAAVAGVSACAYNLTAWLAPQLQPWPAVIVSGIAVAVATALIAPDDK